MGVARPIRLLLVGFPKGEASDPSQSFWWMRLLYAVYAPHDKTTLVLGFAFAIRARRVDPGLNEDLIVTVSNPVERNGLLYVHEYFCTYTHTYT